eukprot:172772-Rhodomonas_salina.16
MTVLHGKCFSIQKNGILVVQPIGKSSIIRIQVPEADPVLIGLRANFMHQITHDRPVDVCFRLGTWDMNSTTFVNSSMIHAQDMPVEMDDSK